MQFTSTVQPAPEVKHGRSLIGTRSGLAATEFALCVPVILLLGFACADFGRVAYFRQIVCNAARTGAEVGATHKFTAFTKSQWESEINDAVLAEMNNMPGFDSSGLTYELSTTVDSDKMAIIDVTVAYTFHTVVNWPGLPNTVPLRHTAEFRQFR
jgi:Flp pilus assembly protein TadG